MERIRVFPFAAFVVSFTAIPAHAALRDPNFVETEFVTTKDDADLSGLAWAPDDSNRLFLIGKEGPVHVVEDGVVRPEPFVNVSASLYFGSECGLVGIAFDPNYLVNRYVYLFMTVSNTEQRIVRYRDEDSRGVDETTIVSGLPTRGFNHDGGAIGFGPDGKLYWAVGDLGNATGVNADLTSLASKVGRANRDGTVPGDNPFDDGSGPNHDLIWARGFRNPFSMTFQPTTGRLWLNVVGTYYEQAFVVGAGDHGGWSDHEYDMPAEFIRPVISYLTNGSDTYALASAGAVRSGGVSTFTVGAPHRLVRGAEMTIAGVGDASFNGTGHIASVPTPVTFTMDQTGPDATSGGGEATTANLGGCITGGTFFDSSAGSVEYRENFFFGDFNSGFILRTPVEGATPTQVSIFGEGHTAVVDIGVGPDGDLYYVSHNGPGLVYRARFRATAQGLVVTPLHLRMLENGDAVFNVRLAMQPTQALEVAIARRSGDTDVTLVAGQTLGFDASDWSRPKAVRVSAARDADGVEDVATFGVTAAGVSSEVVTVRVTDEFRSAEPPGEAGSGGVSDGGMGGDPDGRTGGVGQGGESSAGAPAGGGGNGGDAEAGEAGAPTGSSASGKSEGGCGCSTSRGGGASAGSLALLALLLRRRRSARNPNRTFD